MGTSITLEVGGLALDYSKNHRGNDHGSLFQEADRKRFISKEVEREAVDDEADLTDWGFSRRLGDTILRLELLGYTLKGAESAYYEAVDACLEEDGTDRRSNLMNFSEYRAFVVSHPLSDLSSKFVDSLDYEEVRGRFNDEKLIQRIPDSSLHDSNAYSELTYFGNLIEVIPPYFLLRLLAENPSNKRLDIDWQYGPLRDAGWAKEEEFIAGARRTQTFLIATEGSSDAYILKHAIKLLRPEIEDFFRFIDVSERHPFPGTGNLLKFAEGLTKIDIQNKTVFVFDNDAEGFETHQRMSQLSLPQNMRSMLLPPHESFQAFPARGPMGVSTADINRRAASIECYLDLELPGLPHAEVIWTNYRKDLDAYQGVLERKGAYTKAFLRQKRESIGEEKYKFTKIELVLDALLQECSEMAAQTLFASM